MKPYLTCFLISCSLVVFGQKQDCGPQPGIPTVCDSVYKQCRIDAYYLTMIAVSKPGSQWYDSLYYPDELMFNYTNAMAALYNDLPDSLKQLRTYHYSGQYPATVFHPDSTAIISVYLPLDHSENCAGAETRRKQVDSLLVGAGLLYLEQYAYASLAIGLSYKCPPMINRALLERRLKKICPEIEITSVYKYRPWRHIIEVSEGPDTYSIAILETSKCMPPELMCTYTRRNFVYQQEWGVHYHSFEKGIVPWPLPNDD